MTDVSVFLGGEGRNELGSRVGDVAYQTDAQPGVIEALLKRVEDDGWIVVGATKWSRIRKFRARGPSPADERNVLGLVLDAKEASASVVAFLRDADDDLGRPTTITAAIDRARTEFPTIDVIGGCAIPVLEAWILAMRGEWKTEEMRKVAAQTRLEQSDFGKKGTAAMVELIESLDLSKLPSDATSLRSWLQNARILSQRVEEAKARE